MPVFLYPNRGSERASLSAVPIARTTLYLLTLGAHRGIHASGIAVAFPEGDRLLVPDELAHGGPVPVPQFPVAERTTPNSCWRASPVLCLSRLPRSDRGTAVIELEESPTIPASPANCPADGQGATDDRGELGC